MATPFTDIEMRLAYLASLQGERLVQHSAPLQFSMIARPHEVGLVDSWRADSQSRSVARSRNYPMCEKLIHQRNVAEFSRIPHSR